mgnify:CR=1 FL=1
MNLETITSSTVATTLGGLGAEIEAETSNTATITSPVTTLSDKQGGAGPTTIKPTTTTTTTLTTTTTSAPTEVLTPDVLPPSMQTYEPETNRRQDLNTYEPSA